MVISSLMILGLWAGCLYALVAMGIVLFRRVHGFVNFAHGAAILTSAYLTYACVTWGKMTVIRSATVALTCTCILALALETCVFRPLRRRGAAPFVLMVASLGLFLVIENVIALMFGDQALRFPIARARAVRITIAMLTPTQIGAMIAVATFTALSAAVLKTRMGVGLRAVAADAELATTSGIDRKKIDMVATVMATLPAAVAGILWAYDNDLNITMGFRLLLFGLTASVVGGSRWGTSALVGGLTVGVVQYTSIWRIGTEWQDSIVFGLLVIGLIFKPDGLLGTALPRRTG